MDFKTFKKRIKLKINWEFQGDYSFKSGEMAFKELHKKQKQTWVFFLPMTKWL